MERGTLYQIRNLINRRNVTSKPKSDVNAAEDFLEIVVVGYIIAAIMAYLSMTSLEDVPDPNIVAEDIWWQDDMVRASLLQRISGHIVDEYVDLASVFEDPSLSEESGGGTANNAVREKGTVYDYTCEVISLGLLYLNFKDAVREGDGDRILLMWKYLMLIWKATGHKNYAIEAFTLLSQYHLILPPNLAEQLKWSRFVNVHGLPGHNISCDLHMEHLNRLVKTAIEGLGANKSKQAITRAGKAIGLLAMITQSFDKEVSVSSSSGKHSQKSLHRDLIKIIEELLQQPIFNSDTTEIHKSFTSMKKNVIKKLKEGKMKAWMIEKFISAL